MEGDETQGINTININGVMFFCTGVVVLKGAAQ